MMSLPEISDNDTLPQATCNMQSPPGALPCDAWHHFYHYQASAQYLWLAETLSALGEGRDAQAAYERAVFQDHFNQEALEGRDTLRALPPPERGRVGVGVDKGIDAGKLKQETPSLTRLRRSEAPASPRRVLPLSGGGNIKYDRHPLMDSEFCVSIGQKEGPATVWHDNAVALMEVGGIAAAEDVLTQAISLDASHSNSFFARGRCRFLKGEYEAARDDFMEAVRLSHILHDSYHRAASDAHLARGRELLKEGSLDLAINDFTKALDLHRANEQALAARARAYRQKGSIALAEADERSLSA
jgi:tetratricopeptide (TPR) repeat protein